MTIGCCIVDIDFLYNNANVVFAKKISICGVTTPNKKMHSKVINYPYPSKKDQLYVENNDDDDDDEYVNGEDVSMRDRNIKYGNLMYPRIDLELAKALQLFNVIVVTGHKQKEFISHYAPRHTVVINTKENRYFDNSVNSC